MLLHVSHLGATEQPGQTWKASLDFKWIRDNRDAVAQNIQNRNTYANVDLVVQLYDKSLALGQVSFILLL